MDRRERMRDALVAVRAALDGLEANIWTALPAVVVDEGFSASKLTVSAQPTIQAQIRAPTAQNWVSVALPKCVDCPVMFTGGGGFVLTFPIAVGDEGLLVFASRCIDAWWQNGGPTQLQAELRMHDLSDGFFIPTGGMSQPKVPGGVSTTTCQLRSLDGSTYVEIAGGQIVNIVAPGGVKITADVEITGNVTATGSITAGQGGADQVGLQTHKHAQGADSHGDTEEPTAAPTAGT